MRSIIDWSDALAFTICMLHIAVCPYTKVEESFNLQATHDFLLNGLTAPLNATNFDHITFPGVVPRTFIGAICLTVLSYPIKYVLYDMIQCCSIWSIQIIVRCMLAFAGWIALCALKRSISSRFGKDTATCFILICSSQFHLFYYLGRTLPNMFAFILILFGYSAWLKNDPKSVIWLFVFTTIIFRSDTSFLFAPILLNLLVTNAISFWKTIQHGLIASFIALFVTISVDSYYWNRWVWPEGEVLWYNTVQNKSHEWGTMPFLWYFYSALPRTLLTTVCLLPFGVSPLLSAAVSCRSYQQLRELFSVFPLFDWTCVGILGPVLLYIALYSFLPHKETRFIFSTIPVFNLVSAIGMTRIYRRRIKRQWPFIVAVTLLAIASFGVIIFIAISRVNYPGGRALAWLHEVASHESSSLKSVYIDTAAAINGVSRFGEIYRPNWTYVKDEDVDLDRDWFAFDYIISIKSLGKIPANKKRSIVKMGSSSGLNENDIGWWYLRFLVKAPELLVYNVTQKNG
ncbi:unnamed protein product [Albugo candida]|uniref:Mannosyltransferase n=1 Tax=Albugo candida TaxID=65357 RepID=A0A024G2Y5_9STRA|nr:unnamed protein product [Albugo candida]|eukprot:CCI40877.1 unnamed protein product [Albugo candida]